MSTIQTLRTVSAASAAMLLAGISHGQTHTSAGTGNWNNTATWTQGTVPAAGSSVLIQNGDVVTITDARQVTSVTVSNGQLKIDGTVGTPAELEFPSTASSPSMSLAAADDLELVDYARVEVQQNMTWSTGGTGSVKGDDDASCEIAIGNPSSASNVTLTLGSNLRVYGELDFTGIGTGSHQDNLANGFRIEATTGMILFASSLESVDDPGRTGSCSDAVWSVVGGSAVLQFDVNATGLEGYFKIDTGTLQINASVTTAGKKKVLNNGQIAGDGSFASESPDC